MSYKFGLIGYPIQHSLSPWIHDKFLSQLRLEGTYSIIEIHPENDSFDQEMERLRNSDLDGFNVTVPYKEKVIPYLDELDLQAKQIGAVNTIRSQDGKWIGYNTDGIGYVRSLVSAYPSIEQNKQQQILLLGAGGAAKGIYHALKFNHFSNITIANRSIERAQEIKKDDDVTSVITLQEAEEQLSRYDLIIQTTSVGMKPHIDDTIISLEHVKEGAIVSDIVYQPLLTKFLQEAKRRSCPIHFGHTMLLYQAQYAFELWTGKLPEMTGLADELQSVLEG